MSEPLEGMTRQCMLELELRGFPAMRLEFPRPPGEEARPDVSLILTSFIANAPAIVVCSTDPDAYYRGLERQLRRLSPWGFSTLPYARLMKMLAAPRN